MALKYVVVPEAVVLDFAATEQKPILPFDVFYGSLLDHKIFATPDGIEARKSLAKTLEDTKRALLKELIAIQTKASEAKAELDSALKDLPEDAAQEAKDCLQEEFDKKMAVLNEEFEVAKKKLVADSERRQGKVVLTLDSADLKCLTEAVLDPEYTEPKPQGGFSYVKGYQFAPRVCQAIEPYILGVKNASTEKPEWA